MEREVADMLTTRRRYGGKTVQFSDFNWEETSRRFKTKGLCRRKRGIELRRFLR